MLDLPLTLLAAADASGAPDVLGHVIDDVLVGAPGGVWWISQVTLLLVVTGAIMLGVLLYAAGRIRTGTTRTAADFRTQGVVANMIEAVCVYLRNEVFRPSLREYTDRFAPVLWTFFFFILISNLVGLVPLRDLTGLFGVNHGHGVGGTATQSIFVTGALALIAFGVINIPPLLKDPVGYVKHLTGGTPFYIWPIMIPVELLGTFVKPFALCMRLFANMTGGHIVVAVMLSFIPMLIGGLGVGVGGALSVLPIAAVIGIYFLEILVAFIQAFVFTFLVALFLGQLMVHDHEHGEHGEHGHGDHETHDAQGVSADMPARPAAAH